MRCTRPGRDAGAVSGSRSAMKKILLVSHQEAFLERNKQLLNRAGFLILTAASAEAALETYREERVDLIIAALDLPGMGGDALCSLIRSQKELRQVPFILVCYETEAELERAARCSANARVTKPVRPDLLLTQIGRFLDIPTRRDYRVSFRACVNGTSGTLLFTGMTRNISVSGLLCETSMRLAPDDLITDLLLTIGPDTIEADARVVWSDSRSDGLFLYGVQFTELAQGSREIIARFVDHAGQQA